jgi:hypothetical protein
MGVLVHVVIFLIREGLSGHLVEAVRASLMRLKLIRTYHKLHESTQDMMCSWSE